MVKSLGYEIKRPLPLGAVWLIILLIVLGSIFFKKREPPKMNYTQASIRTAQTLNYSMILSVDPRDEFQSKTKNTQAICTSNECIRTAKTLKYSMNLSVDPCNDFYNYACGKWSEDNLNHGWWNVFSSDHVIRERLTISAMNLLISKEQDLNGSKALQKSRDLYTSCIDENTISNQVGLSSVYKYLRKVELPLIPSIFKSNYTENSNYTFNWMKTETLLKKKFMMDVFIGLRVDRNIKNSSRNDIILTKISPNYSLASALKRKQGLPVRIDTSESRLTKEQKSNIIKFIMNKVILNITNQSLNDYELQNAADIIIKLTNDVNQLVANSFSSSYFKNQILLFTIKTLQAATDERTDPPQSNFWPKYFDLLFEGTNIKLDPDKDPLYTTTLGLSYLYEILRFTLRNPYEVELYMWWQLVKVVAPLTSPEVVSYINQQVGIINPTATVAVPRKILCASVVMNFMGYAVGYSLADKYFSNVKRDKVKLMIDEIKQAFIDNLEDNYWMDSQTKAVTRQKDKEMLSIIGYPDWLLDKEKLDQYYEDVIIQNNTYLDNLINIITSRNLHTMHSLRTKRERGWELDPMIVNAYHKYQENTIIIPMAILDFPFYNLGSEALNFGAVGSLLAHELIHGFDNTGRLLDMYGNLGHWWSYDTIAAYKDLTRCFIDQYDKFRVPRIHQYIDGTRTLNENIADNGGLHQAFTAYKNYVQKYGEEPRLVGFENFTNYQMFFIAHGNSQCETTTLSELQYIVQSGAHCPDHIRLLGTLQNSKDFADVFNCPVGSKMNPRNKCKIW